MKRATFLFILFLILFIFSAWNKVDKTYSNFINTFLSLSPDQREEVALKRHWVKLEIPYIQQYSDMIPTNLERKMPPEVLDRVLKAAEQKEMEFPFDKFKKIERWIPSEKDMKFMLGRYAPDENEGVKFGDGDGVNMCDLSMAIKGDVLLVHNGFVPWGWHSHAGIFYGGTGVYSTIESDCNQNYFGDPHPGVHFEPVSHWNNDYDFCRIMRVITWPLSTSYRSKAAEYARKQLGKPYNFNWLWKWATDKFYCSQLVWAGYYRTSKWYARIDIDAVPSDTWVAPDELYASWRTWTVTSSW